MKLFQPFKILLGCVFVLWGGTAAQAGWAFTQWGMSVEEVIAKSNGQIEPVTGKVDMLSSFIEIDGVPRGVILHFKENHLEVVQFDIAGTDKPCEKQVQKLAAVIGEGKIDRKELLEVFVWNDKENSNHIRYMPHSEGEFQTCLFIYTNINNTKTIEDL